MIMFIEIFDTIIQLGKSILNEFTTVWKWLSTPLGELLADNFEILGWLEPVLTVSTLDVVFTSSICLVLLWAIIKFLKLS